jgi:hypothetical protein
METIIGCRQMRTLAWLLMTALALSACAAGDYQTSGHRRPGDALAQLIASGERQALAPEFNISWP